MKLIRTKRNPLLIKSLLAIFIVLAIASYFLSKTSAINFIKSDRINIDLPQSDPLVLPEGFITFSIPTPLPGLHGPDNRHMDYDQGYKYNFYSNTITKLAYEYKEDYAFYYMKYMKGHQYDHFLGDGIQAKILTMGIISVRDPKKTEIATLRDAYVLHSATIEDGSKIVAYQSDGKIIVGQIYLQDGKWHYREASLSDLYYRKTKLFIQSP